MRQILFEIPLHSLIPSLPNVPVYGWGAMLFVSLVACVVLACWLAGRQGISREVVQDMVVWLVVGGILGARVTFMIQYPDNFTSPLQFFAVWDGGMVSYGCFVGGTVGFILCYRFLLRKHGLRFWQMGDLIAPCLALGFCLGRVGCLLNGCCYGAVACPDCPAVQFTMPTRPRFELTGKGYQTAAGFTMDERARDDRTVGTVVPGSDAERKGLRPGDVIVRAEGHDIHDYADLAAVFAPSQWRRSKNDVSLTVRHADGREEELPPFEPLTIGLHPTQVYESVSMALLTLLLLAYLPFRRHEGEAVALFCVGYGAQRFLDELLRDDTPRVLFGLNWGQLGSVLLVAVGVVVWLWLRSRPAVPRPAAEPAAGSVSAAPAPTGAAAAAH
jgi:phosphatidylglycerol:prolipoprotein diacylglycerol transferase